MSLTVKVPVFQMLKKGTEKEIGMGINWRKRESMETGYEIGHDWYFQQGSWKLDVFRLYSGALAFLIFKFV